VALTTFELLLASNPFNDIQTLLHLSPLRRFIPSSQTHFSNEALRKVCSAMLTASDSTVRSVTRELRKLRDEIYGKHTHIPALLPRLQDDYTDTDDGILVALICMNYLVLQPGEAVNVLADGIHAWLSGDIVECMARSDNVLNTGFCPRADRDRIDLFTSALTFDPHSAEQSRLEMATYYRIGLGATREYAPPMSELNLLITQMNADAKEAVKAIPGPSIMIATNGKGIMRVAGKELDLSFGYVFLVGQGVGVTFETKTEKMIVHRAHTQ
jgi:mannose-6-phosphate isomerase